MSLTDLPNDCLLACLARVPYADLRNVIPSTSKQLRDAVASSAFRKTREAAGCVEYGVFATARGDEVGSFADYCLLITESGVRRTAPSPPNQASYFVVLVQNEVITMNIEGTMHAQAYNPSENTWREIAPLVRDLDGTNYDALEYYASVGCMGGHLLVLGGGVVEESYEAFQRRMDAYDPAEDTWSRLPDLPFPINDELEQECVATRFEFAEVDGKLYCVGGYRGIGDQEVEARRTFVYDPATRTWTDGPLLPHEPGRNEHGYEYLSAFERSKRLCIMGNFRLDDGDARLLAFVWDPTRETWDDFPVPSDVPRRMSVSQVDGHVVVHGHDGSSWQGHITWRIIVLRAGSRDWTEWDIPAAVQDAFSWPLFYAVRIG